MIDNCRKSESIKNIFVTYEGRRWTVKIPARYGRGQLHHDILNVSTYHEPFYYVCPPYKPATQHDPISYPSPS